VSAILSGLLAAVVVTVVVVVLVIWVLPAPNRRSLWRIVIALAGVALALVGVLVLLRARENRRADEFDEGRINPIPATAESVGMGEAIYRQQCQVCHGASGGGNGPGAAGLNPPVSDFRVHLLAGHTDGRFFHWISEGIPGTAMPAFKDRLRDEERWHVINFIRHTFTPQEK
jgi:mono/diheme cytochrome c family protein